jgi:flavodoxin
MEQQIKKALIVYFSMTGHTKHAVDLISKMIDSDVEIIKPQINFHGFTGFIKACAYSLMGMGCKIQPISQSTDKYDIVIICSPMWLGKISSPVREFLHHKKDIIGNYALMVSCQGSEADEVFREAEKILGKPAISKVSINKKDRLTGKDYTKVGQFVEIMKFKLNNTGEKKEN